MTTAMTEERRVVSVNGREGDYFVNAHGQLFSCIANGGGGGLSWSPGLPGGQIAKGKTHHAFWTMAKTHRMRLLDVTWRAWFGDVPEGFAVAPIDGDEANFALTNLRLVSK